jgi:hypothetical protein
MGRSRAGHGTLGKPALTVPHMEEGAIALSKKCLPDHVW